MRSFPGPSIFNLLSNALEFKNDPLKSADKMLKKYGDAIQIQVAWMPVMAFNSCEYYDEVLRKKYSSFPKSDKYKEVSALMGEGLATSDGDFWRQNRTTLQKLFNSRSMENYFGKLDILSKEYIKELSKNPERDFYQDMMEFALASITTTLFNKDYSHNSREVSLALQDFMKGMEDRIFQIVPGTQYLPLKKNKRYQESIKILKDKVREIIHEKKTSDYRNQDDLVSLLLQCQENSEKFGVTDDYIQDEVMTFFLAGHETTASALSWLIGMLAQHPQEQKKVQEEIDREVGNEINLNELNKLKWLDNCLNESLRLYPPLWMTSRQAIKDETIAGKHVPKGTIVVLSPYFLHRNEKYWSQPEIFDPGRFNDPLKHKDSFQPFSIGPRGCIGERFSRLEVKILATRLLQNYDFELKEGFNLKPLPTITMRPKNGLPIKFSRRKK